MSRLVKDSRKAEQGRETHSASLNLPDLGLLTPKTGLCVRTPQKLKTPYQNMETIKLEWKKHLHQLFLNRNPRSIVRPPNSRSVMTTFMDWKLTLPFAGNVEVNATAKEDIIVKLEKYGTGTNEEIVQTYLEAVQIDTSTKDDILVLTPRAPEPPNSDSKLTRLNCLIETPSDLTLEIKTESGDIRVHGIRGDMALTTTVGNIHLDEAMGAYQVSTQEGLIYGKILLTGSANTFETQSGSIDLVIMDEIAAKMVLSARSGAISLRLPESYPADIEMQVEDDNQRAISIDLPVELETAYVGDIVQGWINGGGPLIQMTASNGITIRPSQSVSTESKTDDDEPEVDDPYAEDDLPPPPTVDVPRASVQPVIDGDLFEKAWAKSVPLSPFYRVDAITQPSKPTQGFLLCDDQYLYIGARVYDSQMEQVQITQTNPDSDVWLDDTLEIPCGSQSENSDLSPPRYQPDRYCFRSAHRSGLSVRFRSWTCL